MQADRLLYRRFGEPRDVLELERRTLPAPQAGELLVRLAARPINPSDLIPIRGAYAHRIPLPGVPGYEGVGRVEAVGPGVPASWLGKRVLPLRGEGTWQQFAVAPAEWAVEVPDSLDDDTAAQLYINPVTAFLLCTEIAPSHPGDWWVVNAGGSAIGRVLAQLSSVFGYRLIAVTRSGVHTASLLALGAEHVLDASDAAMGPLPERVQDLTGGRGAAVAIDSVGGPAGLELLACTRPGGTMLGIGLLSGSPLNLSAAAAQADVRFGLFHLRHWLQDVTPARWHAAFERIVGLLNAGQLRLSPISGRYPLEVYREAIEAAERSGGAGKILLV